MARVVGDLQQEIEGGDLLSHATEAGSEGGVVDDAAGAGVVEQVLELLVDVAVVDVERCDPRGVGPEHAFEVLVAVVEVQGKVLLSGLPGLEIAALSANREPLGDEEVGEPALAAQEIEEREPPIAPDDRLTCGDGFGHRVEDRRDVEVHLCPPVQSGDPTGRATARSTWERPSLRG